MAVNSTNNINNIYMSLLNGITGKTTAATKSSAQSLIDSIGSGAGIDTLNLSSTNTDLASFLNYDEAGTYGDIFGSTLDTGNMANSDINSIFSSNGEDSSNSFSGSSDNGMFDVLIKGNVAYTNLLMQQAVEKLNESKAKATASKNNAVENSANTTIKNK